MRKKLSIILVLLLVIFNFSWAICEKEKAACEKKEAEFKKITEKMKSPGIDKATYDKLHKQYVATWNELTRCKKEFEKCKKKIESKHLYLLEEAIKLYDQHKYKESLVKSEESLKEKPGFVPAINVATQTLVYLDDNAKFEKYVEQIKDKNKKGVFYKNKSIKIKHKNPKKSISYLTESAKYYEPAKAYYSIGVIYMVKLADLDSAIKNFRKSIRLDSKKGKVYNALGAALIDKKREIKGKKNKDLQHQKAIDVFLKGVALGPKSFTRYSELCARLAQAYNVQGNAKNALKYSNKAIKYNKDKSFGLPYLEKGKALIKMKKYDEAKTYLKKALKDINLKSEAETYMVRIEELKKK